MQHFRFWCQKVLPLVYDDALSYYEIVCKVVTYINKLIDQDQEIIDQLNKFQASVNNEFIDIRKEIQDNYDELKKDINIINQWITKFDFDKLEKYVFDLVEKYIATMIFVEISDNGYFVYYIPERWDDIDFKTTGLDIVIPDTEYGRLVLIY